MRIHHLLLGGLLSAMLFWMGCTQPPQTTDKKTTELTWYKDIHSIVTLKCNGCHTKGGIAPFALETYDQFLKHKDASIAAIKSGRMPPWPGDKACTSYSNDLSLSDEEKSKILTWFEKGLKQGDEKDKKAVKRVSNELPRVDVKLQIPVRYVPKNKPDDYRCFVIEWKGKETQYVTGFRIKPGNGAIVHHVAAFLGKPGKDIYDKLSKEDPEPGYECFGGSRGGNDALLGAWIPGTSAQIYPKGTGIKVKPGSKVILQIHYNVLMSNPAPDQTSVEFMVTDKVDKEAVLQPYLNFKWYTKKALNIPAGQTKVVHRFSEDFASLLGRKFQIYGVMPHMHLLGTRFRMYIERKDGTRECLLDIPKWDFNWQFLYRLKKTAILAPGDKLGLECHYDNSAKNQPVIKGKQVKPKDVNWGEGTLDEMCVGVMLATCTTTTGKPVPCLPENLPIP